MRILVTGCAGRLGRVLLPKLLAAADVRGVIGIDIVKPAFTHPRFAFIRADIRDPQLAGHFAEVDALIHLAFVVMQADLKERRNDREYMRDINVAGGQNVFNAAAAQGVGTVVHLSSAAVYALPAQTEWIAESHPRAALPGFGYAEDKVELENWLDSFETLHPAIRLVRLRPHVILGPHAHPFLKTLLRVPLYPNTGAAVQCVHEDDVVHAIRLALFNVTRGAFNLACSDAHTYGAIYRQLHPLALPLPLAAVQALLRKAWRFGYGTDPAWAQALRYSLKLDIRGARAGLGWTPRTGFLDICRATLKRR